MNLYKLTQNKTTGYDTYDSCIVCAESEAEAITIHPDRYFNDPDEVRMEDKDRAYSWCDPEHVSCELIGTTINQEKGVILASFYAG